MICWWWLLWFRRRRRSRHRSGHNFFFLIFSLHSNDCFFSFGNHRMVKKSLILVVVNLWHGVVVDYSICFIFFQFDSLVVPWKKNAKNSILFSSFWMNFFSIEIILLLWRKQAKNTLTLSGQRSDSFFLLYTRRWKMSSQMESESYLQWKKSKINPIKKTRKTLHLSNVQSINLSPSATSFYLVVTVAAIFSFKKKILISIWFSLSWFQFICSPI